ncbi:hypothetical protein KAR48_01680 [bacterium]|nr:hypothetical protein [bacterium]
MILKRFAIPVLLLCSHTYAQTPFGIDTDLMIQRGIDHTIMARFDAALAVFDSVRLRHPRHPVGWFYTAATLQSKMMDYESVQWKKEFYAAADSTEERGRQMLKENKNDAWAQFYLGSILSYKGLFQVKTGKLLGGFTSAKKGLGHLKKSVEIDTSLSGAYLGLGSYDYWSGRYYQYLRFLPWIKDRRERGIIRLHKAVRRSRFSYYVALNSLAWVEYDRENFDKALSYFNEGLRHYPGSRFFLWGIADTFYKMENYREAIKGYSTLLASVISAPMNNGYNEAICRLRLAYCNAALEEHEVAFKFCDALLNRDYGKRTHKRLKDDFKAAREIRQSSLKALGRIEVRYE